MSRFTDRECEEIRFAIGNAWPALHSIAERYASKKLPSMSPYHLSVITTSFLSACGDFLSRGNQEAAGEWEQQATTLRAAADILRKGPPAVLLSVLMSDDITCFDKAHVDYRLMDETRHFVTVTSEMESVTFALDAGVNTVSRSGEQVVWALETIGRGIAISARVRKRIRKNLTFFYCLGARLQDAYPGALPSATQANDVYMIMLEAIRGVIPEDRLKGIKTYDPRQEGSEIRRLMKQGAASLKKIPETGRRVANS